jgi:hypothetical protein
VHSHAAPTSSRQLPGAPQTAGSERSAGKRITVSKQDYNLKPDELGDEFFITTYLAYTPFSSQFTQSSKSYFCARIE